AGFEGAVSVEFIPEDATICDSAVSVGLATPDGFDNGTMSLSATISGRPVLGPFTYSAASAAWTSVPGAPGGQQLVTRFDPLSVTTSVDPGLKAQLGGDDPGLSLQIADLTIDAVHQDVTLVAPPGPSLKVGLGPTLDIGVEIKKGAADDAAEDAESEGMTRDE